MKGKGILSLKFKSYWKNSRRRMMRPAPGSKPVICGCGFFLPGPVVEFGFNVPEVLGHELLGDQLFCQGAVVDGVEFAGLTGFKRVEFELGVDQPGVQHEAFEKPVVFFSPEGDTVAGGVKGLGYDPGKAELV